jgi:hypothetical protein
MVVWRIIPLVVWATAAWPAQGQEPGPPSPSNPPALPCDFQPRLVFDTLEHDFGSVEDGGGEVSFRFNFVNQGPGVLVLRRDRGPVPSSQQTHGVKYDYAPGETGYYEVRLNPHAKKRGPVRQRLTIHSNDPNHQPDGPELIVTAFVYRAVTFDPPSVDFGEVPAGTIARRTITVTGLRPEFAVTYASTTKGRHVTAKVLKTVLVPENEVVGTGPTPQNIPSAVADLRNDQLAFRPPWLCFGSDGTASTPPSLVDRATDGGLMLTRCLIVSAMTLAGTAGFALGQDAPRSDFQPGTIPPQAVQPQAPMTPGQPVAVKLPDGTDSASKIEFKQMEFDFGKISDQGEVKTEFHFKNNGTGKLVFKPDQKASCGCTAGKPTNMKGEIQFEFAPGEEGYIDLKFNAHGKRGDTQQRLTVQSYDPYHQPEGPVLTIRAKIKPTITFDPPSVGFGDVMAGQVKKEIIKVNGAKAEFEVPYLSTSKGRYVTTRVLETKQVEVDGEKVGQSTIELTLNTNNLPRGNFNATATVRTNDPSYWLADFPISASVVGDLQVLPPRLNVGVIELNQPYSKTFKVSSRSGGAFKISKIEQKAQLPSPLEVTFAPVEPGNETAYMVTVKGAGLASQMPINATLSVMTDSQTDPVIDVLLSGAVRGPQQAGMTPGMPGGPPPAVYTPVPAPTNPGPAADNIPK